MTVATLVDVRTAVEAVADPELPPVTIADLGMVIDVVLTDEHAQVRLVPTFSGCPATDVIRWDVEQAVSALPGVTSVEVEFVRDVVWTPDRISPTGRDKLRAFGIAPPHDADVASPVLLQIGGVTCPICGSRNTVAESPFGPTPCRSTHYCDDCRNPFEAIKA